MLECYTSHVEINKFTKYRTKFLLFGQVLSTKKSSGTHYKMKLHMCRCKRSGDTGLSNTYNVSHFHFFLLNVGYLNFIEFFFPRLQDCIINRPSSVLHQLLVLHRVRGRQYWRPMEPMDVIDSTFHVCICMHEVAIGYSMLTTDTNIRCQLLVSSICYWSSTIF